ncbi:MAG: hypothetical protein KC535_01230 [Nanoarchaeota archaeon]|nr:hypothetical protein [Nanoarchaeota archaeon]
MNKYPLSRNIYKNDLFSRALNNRFNTVRLRAQDRFMRYDFNFIAG